MDTIRIGNTTSLEKQRRINTSAGCFLVRKSNDNKYEMLVIHKKWSDEKDEYSLPKGHKEKDETLEQAALRETLEESGFKNVKLLNYIGSRTYEIDWDEIQLKTDHYFLAKLEDEERLDILPEDYEPGVSVETIWLDLDEGFNLLTNENHSEFLTLIKELLTSSQF